MRAMDIRTSVRDRDEMVVAVLFLRQSACPPACWSACRGCHRRPLPSSPVSSVVVKFTETISADCLLGRSPTQHAPSSPALHSDRLTVHPLYTSQSMESSSVAPQEDSAVVTPSLEAAPVTSRLRDGRNLRRVQYQYPYQYQVVYRVRE